MRWSPEVLGDETGYKDPFLINQNTETFFTSIFSFAIFAITEETMQGSIYHAIKSEL